MDDNDDLIKAIKLSLKSTLDAEDILEMRKSSFPSEEERCKWRFDYLEKKSK